VDGAVFGLRIRVRLGLYLHVSRQYRRAYLRRIHIILCVRVGTIIVWFVVQLVVPFTRIKVHITRVKLNRLVSLAGEHFFVES
jgi:hypothetical protein